MKLTLTRSTRSACVRLTTCFCSVLSSTTLPLYSARVSPGWQPFFDVARLLFRVASDTPSVPRKNCVGSTTAVNIRPFEGWANISNTLQHFTNISVKNKDIEMKLHRLTDNSFLHIY